MSLATVTTRGRSDWVVLLAAFGAALTIRVTLAGPAGAASLPASIVFAALLAGIAAIARPVTTFGPRPALLGLAGAVILLLPVALLHGLDLRAAGGYRTWAAATVVVASAEEAFLRGALFSAVDRWRGADAAVVVAAVAFALLHVPLYGWHVLPLDFAVGLLLGSLRLLAGTWTAPALAHAGADLAGWWFL